MRERVAVVYTPAERGVWSLPSVEREDMAFKKKESAALGTLKRRVDGMKQIDPQLDLGDGISVKECEAKLDEYEKLVDDYNALLSKADLMAVKIDAAEKDAREVSSRIMSLVKGKYGRSSEQVAAVGGKPLNPSK